ncbi:hypothetical protein [Carnobacterium sp. 1290_CSPC]|uniref:hypothetical protein n=1 Tax=Carnobacterium sp. 1290_CSPC TaxID=1579347 RepID=UPI0006606D18|nr:hypothetical protein [Carnobacterium sp. 1290_CSPC]
MKAYVLGLYSNEDAGNELVFANTVKEAKGKNTELDPESYIDLYAHREKAFDGMENTPEEVILEKMKAEGWRIG